MQNILFRHAALDFLQYLSKIKVLNKLERYVLSKLDDPIILTSIIPLIEELQLEID